MQIEIVVQRLSLTLTCEVEEKLKLKLKVMCEVEVYIWSLKSKFEVKSEVKIEVDISSWRNLKMKKFNIETNNIITGKKENFKWYIFPFYLLRILQLFNLSVLGKVHGASLYNFRVFVMHR